MSVGTNIKRIRKLQKVSVAVLAEKTGVNAESIYAWERGEYDPSKENLQSVAKVLDVPVKDFYDENPTHSDIEPAVAEKAPKGVTDAIRTVVEEGTEYYVIPKIIFQKKYMLVAEEQFNKDTTAFNRVLGLLENELQRRELHTKPEGTQDAKQSPGV